MIQLGDRGPYARAVQRIVGVPASKVDGVIGPFSEALIMSWQERHGIEPDGVFGPVSRTAVDPAALIKAYEGLRLATYDDHDGQPLHLVASIWRRPDGAVVQGYPTIGWGRRLWPGQDIETCTVTQADQWLRDFIAQSLGPNLTKYLPKDADAAQQAALSSLGYNGGPGAIVQASAAVFDPAWWCEHYVTTKGVREAGLVMRRAEEASLWAAA